MKPFTVLLIALTLCAAPGFSGERSVKKTPYYRPHSHVRHTPSAKPGLNSSAVVVNAASYEEGVSPGALATIFGENLTTITGILLAGTDPLPTRLAGVEVLVSGIPAPIYGMAYANGEDQISIQVPYDAPTGIGAAEIQVFDQGSLVADFFTDSFTEDPGIFAYGDNYAVATASDYSVIGPDNPAIPGEPLVLWVTGLGPLSIDLLDGYGSPTSPPFAETMDQFQVIVNNEDCRVFFSGLAPGFVGLYQVNFYVPRDAASGNLQIYIQTPYANSAIAILPVR